ncbi:class I adenylate-forming enzyme family protein [Acidiferrimicrobium sp. IK]|uniref:class I adenylate-forming enzyme family protein n=1 Tax=Acidiferrimicrobium sp. IK TaxID=2871700 RepID=UPI0039673BA9
MNLMMILQMAAEAAPDRVAVGGLCDGLTYKQLYQHAGHAAEWLREDGAGRLVYADEASPALPIGLYACGWAGIPFVPVSYRLADDRLRALVEAQAPAVLLHPPGGGERTAGLTGVDQMGTDAFLRLLDGLSVECREWDPFGESAAILLHTSGTSGTPKVAILRHRHLVSYVLGSVEFMSAEEDEATLVSVPPYHIAGMVAILTATYGGRRLVQLPRFTPEGWVELVRAEKVTHAMVVPTMLARILDVLAADGEGLPNLRHLSYGGGRMPRPVVEAAMRLLPDVDFVNAYGLTETSSTVAVLTAADHRAAFGSPDPEVEARLGSVGRPVPAVEVSIRDPLGEEVPAGVSGEVWVRGDQVAGEYGHASVLNEEGWFATKDAGHLDSEGYLFLEGRVDDVIVRGGENLSPGEIEDVLLEHPGIREAVVCGVRDREWGEVVAAAVVPHEGVTLDEGEVRDWVAGRLRSSRAPAVIDIRPELPYTDTGKVLRRVIKPQLEARHQPG